MSFTNHNVIWSLTSRPFPPLPSASSVLPFTCPAQRPGTRFIHIHCKEKLIKSSFSAGVILTRDEDYPGSHSGRGGGAVEAVGCGCPGAVVVVVVVFNLWMYNGAQNNGP